jgi:hypothetical protein
LTEGPEALFLSREADVFIDRHPDLSELIDGCIGELSPFDQTFGCYAHGMDEETATLPEGWRDRLVGIENPNTGGTAGLCLALHDLAASKLIAGRDKDHAFLKSLLSTGRLDMELLRQRIAKLPIEPVKKEGPCTRLERLLSA